MDSPDTVLRKIRAERQRRECVRLKPFAQQVFKLLWPRKQWVDGWHIDAICEHLEALADREFSGLIINIPPRHVKSTLCSVAFPAWLWTRDQGETILSASYAASLATRDAVRSRRIIESPWFQGLWPGVDMVDDQNQKTRYENAQGGYRLATSVGGTVTGEGGSVRILDDPHKAGDPLSEARRESDLMWIAETWASREDANPVELVVMQRLHEMDTTGHYLAEVGGYEHLMLPARCDASRRCHTVLLDDPREDGEELWPGRPGADLNTIENRLGPHAWASQYQQEPTARGGSLVRGEWFRYWDEIPDGARFVQSWDCAFKATKTSSYVVGQLWACKWPECFLLDEVRARMDFVATQAAIKNATARWDAKGWRAPVKLVEDKANGPAIVSALRTEIDGIREWPVSGGDKVARMSAETALMAAGQVLLPKPDLNPWVAEWIAELERFPHEPNDRGDAASQVLHYFRKNMAGPIGIAVLDGKRRQRHTA